MFKDTAGGAFLVTPHLPAQRRFSGVGVSEPRLRTGSTPDTGTEGSAF